MRGAAKLTEAELDALASEVSAAMNAEAVRVLASVGIVMTDREATIVAVVIGLLSGAVADLAAADNS